MTETSNTTHDRNKDIESADRPTIQKVVMKNNVDDIFTRNEIMTYKHVLDSKIKEQRRDE